MKKIALVTGGSGGIGSAVCRSLASAGWTVGVGYFRSREKAEALAKEIGGFPAYADVSKPEEVEAMFAEAGKWSCWFPMPASPATASSPTSPTPTGGP